MEYTIQTESEGLVSIGFRGDDGDNYFIRFPPTRISQALREINLYARKGTLNDENAKRLMNEAIEETRKVRKREYPAR